MLKDNVLPHPVNLHSGNYGRNSCAQSDVGMAG